MKRNSKAQAAKHDVLTGEATIYRAADLKNELMELLDSASPIRIDLSGVPEIDSSGIQLLLAAKKAAAAQGKTLQFLAPSAGIRSVAALLGLEAQLDLEASQ